LVGTWTYTHATNLLTVTGGTEGAPAGFVDAWNADKAGSEEIVHTRNITGADGAPVAVNHALRPTDLYVLGGTELYITVTNYVAPASTINIVGTDADGNAINENIVVNANGNFNTVLYYRTVTSTQVTVFGGTFTYTFVMGQWGVVWKQATNQYAFDCKIVIGDSSTTTWFIDTVKQVTFNAGCISADGQNLIFVKNKATFRLGTVVDATNKISKNGCSLRVLTTLYWYYYICYQTGASIELYSSDFQASGTDRGSLQANIVWNCLFNGLGIADLFPCGTADFFNINSLNTMYGIRIGTGTFNKITALGCARTIRIAYYTVGTISNVYSRTPVSWLVDVQSLGTTSYNFYLINVDSDVWSFRWTSSSGTTIYRQYEFDLNVTDSSGNPINTATVTLKDKDGNTVFSVSTDANGNIVQQTVSRGYYNQANGNTLQDYGPHTLTITKAGYQTYTWTGLIDEKIDWRITLLPPTGGGVTFLKIKEVPTPIEEASLLLNTALLTRELRRKSQVLMKT
jgi:hypothetical protein